MRLNLRIAWPLRAIRAPARVSIYLVRVFSVGVVWRTMWYITSREFTTNPSPRALKFLAYDVRVKLTGECGGVPSRAFKKENRIYQMIWLQWYPFYSFKTISHDKNIFLKILLIYYTNYIYLFHKYYSFASKNFGWWLPQKAATLKISRLEQETWFHAVNCGGIWLRSWLSSRGLEIMRTRFRSTRTGNQTRRKWVS
jgi:hypothetical protein